MKYVLPLMMGILLALSGLVGGLSYWVFETAPPYITTLSATTVDAKGVPKTDFKSNETLYVRRVVIVSQTRIPTHVVRAIVREDTKEVMVRDSPPPVPHYFGQNTRVLHMHLPEDLTPGRHLLRTFVTYKLNPIREETFEMMPIPFNIVK
jgi:hypothetical protein